MHGRHLVNKSGEGKKKRRKEACKEEDCGGEGRGGREEERQENRQPRIITCPSQSIGITLRLSW